MASLNVGNPYERSIMERGRALVLNIERELNKSNATAQECPPSYLYSKACLEEILPHVGIAEPNKYKDTAYFYLSSCIIRNEIGVDDNLSGQILYGYSNRQIAAIMGVMERFRRTKEYKTIEDYVSRKPKDEQMAVIREIVGLPVKYPNTHSEQSGKNILAERIESRSKTLLEAIVEQAVLAVSGVRSALPKANEALLRTIAHGIVRRVIEFRFGEYDKEVELCVNAILDKHAGTSN